MFNFQRFIVILSITLITACGGKTTVKPQTPTAGTTGTQQTAKGGYYLDDGPGENAPADIDSIPDAKPRTETLLKRANRPYSALGQKYTPMTSYTPYTKQGIASWYGKRYHGRKTSSGEIYDMYAMSGAHTTLPIPSYVRVTNPANKRSVIVRINDRGPFKNNRLIDLSYAAAYKLRLTEQGSGLVEVEWIDTRPEALQKMNTPRAETANVEAVPSPPAASVAPVTNTAPAASSAPAATRYAEVASPIYYVQVGAFKNELNGDMLQRKILGLDLAGNAAVTKVYNGGLYRVKLGPFSTRKEADRSAGKVREQLNITAIVTNQ